MGNTNSSTINQTIDVINQTMVNSFTSTSNSAYIKQASSQEITFEVGPNGSVDCGTGTLTIEQVAQTTVNLQAEFSSKSSADLSAAIKGAIDAAAASSQSQVSGFASTAVADSNNTNITIAEHLKNIVDQNITNITQNSCIADASNIQTEHILINGKLKSNGCHFGQNFQGNLAVNCVTSSVIDLISKDSILSDNIAKAAATQDMKSTGFLQDLGGLLSGLGLTLILPFIIILVVVIIFVVLIRGSSKRKAAEAAQPATLAPPTPITETSPLLSGAPGSPTGSTVGGDPFGERRWGGRRRRRRQQDFYYSPRHYGW